MTTTPQPDPEADWWTTKDVAAYLGIEVAAVSTYRKRGQMPAPDQTIGSRTHVWKPIRIVDWQASRPRPGVGGRPRGRAGHVTTETDTSTEWWTTTDVAVYLGVAVGTVSTYRSRQQMPAPDLTVGRTRMWRPARIVAWHEARPRPGVGGRPVPTPTSEPPERRRRSPKK